MEEGYCIHVHMNASSCSSKCQIRIFAAPHSSCFEGGLEAICWLHFRERKNKRKKKKWKEHAIARVIKLCLTIWRADSRGALRCQVGTNGRRGEATTKTVGRRGRNTFVVKRAVGENGVREEKRQMYCIYAEKKESTATDLRKKEEWKES